MLGARLRSGKQLKVKMAGGSQTANSRSSKDKAKTPEPHQENVNENEGNDLDVNQTPGPSGGGTQTPQDTEPSLTKDEIVRVLQQSGFSTTQVEIFMSTFDVNKPTQMMGASEAIQKIIALEIAGVRDDMRRELKLNLHRIQIQIPISQ